MMCVPAEYFRTEDRILFESGVKWKVSEKVFEVSKKCSDRFPHLRRRKVLYEFALTACNLQRATVDQIRGTKCTHDGLRRKNVPWVRNQETPDPMKHDTINDLNQCCNLEGGGGQIYCCPQILKTHLDAPFSIGMCVSLRLIRCSDD